MFETVAANVLGGFLLERLSEGEGQSFGVNVPGDRHLERFAGVTDALKTAVLERAGLPAGAADNVEMAVAPIERAAHRSRQEASWQRDRRPLRHVVHDIAADEHRHAAAPGEVQHVPGERAPLSALRHPDLAPARIVHTVWNPAQHRIVAQRPFRSHFRAAIAVITVAFGLDDERGRRPFALLRRDGEDAAIGTDARAVGVAETGGQCFHRTTVQRHPMQADGVHVIEVAARVCFEAGHEVVRLGKSLDQVAKVLVKVRLAVSILVVQPRDLVAAEHIDLIVGHFESERLIQTGRKAFPGQAAELALDAGDLPHVAVNRTDVSRAVAGEIHAGKKHQRVPGVVVGNAQCVDG